MSDPRFDLNREPIEPDYARFREDQHSGAAGMWSVAFVAGLVLLLGAMYFFVPEGTTQMASNEGAAPTAVERNVPQPAQPAPATPAQ